MKSLFAKIGPIALLFLFLPTLVFAAPPTLTPISGDAFPTEVRPGDSHQFDLTYKSSDLPSSLKMIVQTPGAETLSVPPSSPPTGDPTAGVPVSWTYTAQNAGVYRYHFEAASQTGETARFPSSPAEDPQFVSVSLVSKYVIFLIGLVVALLFLPFVVYVGARSLNKRGNPAAAARIALLLGIVASYGLFLFLFFTIYSPLLLALGGVVALAILIVLFTRK